MTVPDSAVNFPKIFSPYPYGEEEPVWINPTRVVSVECSAEFNGTIDELRIRWASEVHGSLPDAKLAKFALGEEFEVGASKGVRRSKREVFVNAAAIFAIQSWKNATRLFFEQKSPQLSVADSILVLTTIMNQGSWGESFPPNIAAELGIRLA